MKLLSFAISLFFLFSYNLSGQSDQEAIKILDSFSAKATGAPSISMKFNIISVNEAELTTDTTSGSVILSKDRYRLDLQDNIIFFNGETSWSYLPAENEVTISDPEKIEDSFLKKPSSIFTVYKAGYKCRLIEEKESSYIIDLYPEDIKNELIRIRLTISKPQLNLISLDYKRRDGVTFMLKVLEYDLKKKPSPDTFVFQKDKYRDVEVIDMR